LGAGTLLYIVPSATADGNPLGHVSRRSHDTAPFEATSSF